jgi:hypothetical protein
MSDSAETRAVHAIEAARRERNLDLHGLGLKALPPITGDFSHLRRLNVSGNRLQSLPSEIWQLGRLKHLDLGNNRLRQLDPGVGRLARLESLDLSENRLTTLPIELADCAQLSHLDLFGNLLTELPAAVLSLVSLVKLDLARNRLESLPGLLNRFARLKELDLSGNRIRRLPAGFDTLPVLRVLHLSANQLASIDELVTLLGLEELYLDDNALKEITAGLADLPLLRLLSVDGNPLGALPSNLRHLVAAGRRQRRGKSLRKLIFGGYEQGKRYFDAPQYKFGFSLGLKDATVVVRTLDLYYKEFSGVPLVSLRFPDGGTFDLAGLTRKAALQVLVDYELAEKPISVVLELHPTNKEFEVELNCKFAERTMDRGTGVDLIVHEPHGTPSGAAAIGTVESADPERLVTAMPDGGRRPALGATQRAAVPEAEPVDTAVYCPPRVAKNSTFLVQVYLPADPPESPTLISGRERGGESLLLRSASAGGYRQCAASCAT